MLARAQSTATAALATLVTVAPLLAAGGDWHRDQSLACTDCHTMHNSSGGQPMRYDQVGLPAPALLRHASATELCLYCHDGSRGPSVLGGGQETPAGYFTRPGPDTVTSTAHPLGQPIPVAAPQGDGTPFTLTCVSCHAPHGNASYRNLWEKPSRLDGPAPPEVVVRQAVVANGVNAAQVYTPGNVSYVSGSSGWCLDCHNRYDPTDPVQRDQLSAHPFDRALSTNPTIWQTWGDPTIVNRVRVQNADPLNPAPPHAADQVFCGSCHRAHGNANPRGVVYPDGVSSTSGCVQCHT